MSPPTFSPPPTPGKSVCCLCFCEAKKHQAATGTLFTNTTDYNFRKPLGLRASNAHVTIR